MESNQGQQPGAQGMTKLFEQMTGWPSPDKLYQELQRLNNNMEKMAPDLNKLAKSVDGLYMGDIRLLATVLQSMNLSQSITTIKDFQQTIDKLYQKLWGK